MAKRVSPRPEWLHAAHIVDVYSVSNCDSADFADYIQYWKHNGYWFFDSPAIIRSVAQEHAISLDGTSLFFYEVHEMEFDGDKWVTFRPEESFPTNVTIPREKNLEGFDVVNFTARTSPECSGLCCSSLAETLPTNSHCLLASFENAQVLLSQGAFNNSEPGPYRVFAVYSVDWW